MELKNNIKGLQHIGIPTNDIAKTIEFYKKIGFEVAFETVNGTEKVAFLRINNLVIETYENGKAAIVNGAVDHIAIDVLDIEQAYASIKELDLEVLEEITFLPFWENGVKFFIIKGPNCEKLEFAQYL